MKPSLAVLAATLAATTLLAQAPAPNASPKPRPAPEKPEARTEKEPPRPGPAQLANVRVDVKIIDERAGRPALTKTVSLTIADRNNGSIRASAEEPPGAKGENSALPAGFRSVPLNVDAGPMIEGNRIRLQLGLEYNSVDPKLELKQRLGLVLEDGKTLRVAQSADPLSDRRISLEVTGTILR